MSYDPKVPDNLRELQTWFAGVITQPIDSESHIAPITPSGNPIENESRQYIAPSATLASAQRIEIYNQQYWWRLLNTLQETFPIATRLLGYQRFNETVATPYLRACPSQHWSLNFLGEGLPRWIQDHYQGSDKALIFDAAAVDEAFNHAFFAAQLPSIAEGRTPEEALDAPATLQPHLSLFLLEYDLFRFRVELKQKEPDFWSSHHFPSEKKTGAKTHSKFPELKRGNFHFIVYRTPTNQVMWDDLSPEEYYLLRLFQGGSSISECCDQIMESEEELLKVAELHLSEWIQKWIANQWLASYRSM